MSKPLSIVAFITRSFNGDRATQLNGIPLSWNTYRLLTTPIHTLMVIERSRRQAERAREVRRLLDQQREALAQAYLIRAELLGRPS